MKEIPLTQGKVALVDDEDYDELIKHKWSLSKRRYAARSWGDRNPNLEIYMHRMILGANKAQRVDHISGNTLDNRRCNLRFATNQQNLFNRGKNKNNTSGFKGVAWSSTSRKWKAFISLNGTQIHLGVFREKKSASEAYRSAAKNHHREFFHT